MKSAKTTNVLFFALLVSAGPAHAGDCSNADQCAPDSCPAQNSCWTNSDCQSGMICVPFGADPVVGCASSACLCRAGIWACTPDCAAQCVPESCTPGVAFDVVFHQKFTGFRRVADLVIRTPKQWCAFWAEAHANTWPAPPCDTTVADFRHEVVLVTAIGPRGTTCFDVDVGCIGQKSGRGVLQVHVRDTVSPDCHIPCGRVVVHPVQAIVLDKPVGRVEFTHETVEIQCRP